MGLAVARPHAEPDMTISGKRVLGGAGIFVFFALCLAVSTLLAPDGDTLSRFADRHIRENGPWGCLFFVLLGGALTCLGLPRQVIGFAGGYSFGVLAGTLWSTLASTLGCILAFTCARHLARAAVERRFPGQAADLNALLRTAPLTMTLCVRLLPVGNNLVTSLLGGVSRIPALPFFCGSFIGYLPQNLIFALLGSGVNVDPFWRTLLSAVLFVLVSLIGWRLYHRLHPA
jgi:uncharacterized membrane protein YdjX (TVP38/TMEM64 family)